MDVTWRHIRIDSDPRGRWAPPWSQLLADNCTLRDSLCAEATKQHVDMEMLHGTVRTTNLITRNQAYVVSKQCNVRLLFVDDARSGHLGSLVGVPPSLQVVIPTSSDVFDAWKMNYLYLLTTKPTGTSTSPTSNGMLQSPARCYPGRTQVDGAGEETWCLVGRR